MGRGLGAGPRGGACGLGGRLRELSGAPNGCARAAVGAGGHGGRRGAAERRERDESDRARAAGAPARPGPTRPPARDAPRGRPPAQLTRGPRTPARARPRRRLRRRDGGEGRGLPGHRAAAGHGQRGLAVRRRKCGPARASPACAAAAGRPRSTLAGPDTPRARAPGRRPARARPPEPPEPRLAPRPGPFPGSSSPPRTPEARTPGAGPARRLICAGPRAPSAPRRRGCRQPAPNSAGPDLPPAPRSSPPHPTAPHRTPGGRWLTPAAGPARLPSLPAPERAGVLRGAQLSSAQLCVPLQLGVFAPPTWGACGHSGGPGASCLGTTRFRSEPLFKAREPGRAPGPLPPCSPGSLSLPLSSPGSRRRRRRGGHPRLRG